MTTRAARPTRFLSVNFSDAYGVKQIQVYVCVEIPGEEHIYRDSTWHTARKTGAFSGEALEDFSMTAYAGHNYPTEYDRPGEVWGWTYQFTPSRIGRVEEAQRIVRGLTALDKAMETISYGPGGPGAPSSFADFIRRMAAILRATEIRLYPVGGTAPRQLSAPYPVDMGSELVERIGEAWALGVPLPQREEEVAG